MRLYVCVYIGRLKIENGWRFYWWTEHRDAKTGRNRWHMWDRVYVVSAKAPHRFLLSLWSRWKKVPAKVPHS